jgi:30S ribosomal protein S31
MGKGDKKSKKGKIFKGSFGKARLTQANRNAKAKKEAASEKK